MWVRGVLLPGRQMSLTVDVQPNTEGWHQWRQNVRSASDAPIIMGCAPTYWERRTWAALRTSEPRPEPSDYTRQIWAYGHAREAAYREAHYPHLGPVNLQRGDYGASLDIAELDNPFGPLWWEVKSPTKETSKMWQLAADAPSHLRIRDELPHVWWQLVHQAHVVGGGHCYLVVTDPRGRGHITLPVPYTALAADWPLLRPEWEAYAEGLEPGIRDDAWEWAAKTYLEADTVHREATAEKKKARARLLELAAEQDNPRGAGVSVTESKREGRIDYRAMARDLLTDLDEGDFDEVSEKFRKPGFTVQTIRRTK